MTALLAADRAPLRRWTTSAVIVLLVHGMIATVVNWRKVTSPAEPLSPFVIEVVPIPITPVPPKTEPAPLVPNMATGTPIENLERRAGGGTAPTGRETAGPPAIEHTPGETEPVMLAPSRSAEGDRGVDTQETTPAVAPGAARANRRADNPIDTRIGASNRRPDKQTIKPNDNARKIIMTRPYSGARQLHDQGAGDIVRNTVGLPVRNGIASSKSPNGINEAKNAVGAPKTNTARDTSTITVGRTVRNAIGAQVPPAAGGLSIGAQQGVDPRALRGTTPRAGIDGTAVGHRNTSSIGGPARNPAGAINGTIVHR